MITKFILGGGFDPNNKERNMNDLYKEILRDTPPKLKVLIVPFAKEIDRIPITAERVKGEFNENKLEKEIDFEVANEKDFVEQIKLADIVYFQGGTTLKILNVLKNFSNLKELVKGKIVVGESAGGNALSKFYYTPKVNQIFEGLGVLPIKMIPHYKEEYKDVFKGIGEDLEDVFLKEYEYKVFEL